MGHRPASSISNHDFMNFTGETVTETASYHGVLPTTREKQWLQQISDLKKMIGGGKFLMVWLMLLFLLL